MERDDWKIRTPAPSDDTHPVRRDEDRGIPQSRPEGESPLEMMRRYSQDMERMFENWGLGGARWPALEMFDRNDHLIVRAELPGMKRDDVHVRVIGNALVIEGERHFERADDADGVARSEWRYGRFSREVRIPPDLDSSRLTAHMKDGVLELSVPYREARRVREVRIEDGEAFDTKH